jgi:hypothetical protein
MDFGDEIFVARENDDQQQVRGQGQIHQREREQDYLLAVHMPEVRDFGRELPEKHNEDRAEHQDHAKVEGRQQPARGKQTPLKRDFEFRSHSNLHGAGPTTHRSGQKGTQPKPRAPANSR